AQVNDNEHAQETRLRKEDSVPESRRTETSEEGFQEGRLEEGREGRFTQERIEEENRVERKDGTEECYASDASGIDSRGDTSETRRSRDQPVASQRADGAESRLQALSAQTRRRITEA